MPKRRTYSIKAYHSRLPVQLHERLKSAARVAGTTMAAQVLQRLQDSFDLDDAGREHRARVRRLLSAAEDVLALEQHQGGAE